jgi:hypothetical protein
MKGLESILLLGLGGMIVYLMTGKKERPDTTPVITPTESFIPPVLRSDEVEQADEEIRQDVQVEEIGDMDDPEEEVMESFTPQRSRANSRDNFSEQLVILDNTPFPLHLQGRGGVSDADDLEYPGAGF